MSFTDKSRDIRTAERVTMSGRALEGLACRLPGAGHPRHVVMIAVGLAAAAHMARNPRNLQHVIMVAITLAAIEGLARSDLERLLARLAAWGKRRQQHEWPVRGGPREAAGNR